LYKKRGEKMNIYVGNVPFRMSEEELKNLFAEFGTVESARIITDRDSGRSKGFAFVEMTEKEAGLAAIESLNGKEINERELRVNEARPKEDRPRRRQRY